MKFPKLPEKRPSTGYGALLGKEFADHLQSKLYYVLFALFLVVTVAGLYGGKQAVSDAQSTEFLFLKLFTSKYGALYPYVTFMALLGPLLGVALGFDAITGERNQGTLIRLASQPIYRDGIIRAKFTAGAAAIATVTLTTVLLMCGLGLLWAGIVPGWESVLRIFTYWVLLTVYDCFWLALAIAFSAVCKKAATAAIACVALWLGFILFVPLIAGGTADAFYPLRSVHDHSVAHSALEAGINRLSPYYLLSEATTTILNPSIRATGTVTAAVANGAITAPLAFSQSLLLVWPHLTAIVSLAILTFALAYIFFMRKEIR